MRRALAAIAATILALPAISAVGLGLALAQNTQCPNRPAGDSTNACANTRFVTQNTIATVTIESIGGSCFASDNGPVINTYIAASNGRFAIFLEQCLYRVVTPIINPDKNGIDVVGQGQYISGFDFEPTTDATLFKFGTGVTELASFNFINLSIVSTNTSHIKTGFNFVDVSNARLFNVNCAGFPFSGHTWHDTTGSSICLQTNGRDLSTFEQLYFTGDKPIVLAENPNPTSLGLSTDHYVFRDLYLVSNSTSPCISAAAPLTNLSFVGRQSWALCTGGFKAVDAPVSTGVWSDVIFENIRTEQSLSTSAYSIDISVTTTTLRNLTILNTGFDTLMRGIKLRGVNGWNVIGGVADCNFGVANILDVNTTDDQGFWSVKTGAACTMTPSSGTPMTAVQAIVNPSGSVVPAEAHFYAAAHTFSYTGETGVGSAAAGIVGEYIESLVTGSPVSLVTNTPKNLTSITLSAGDWDVDTYIVFNPDTTTSVSNAIASISLVTNTLNFTFVSHPTPAFVPNVNIALAAPPVRFSVAGSTIVYAVAYSTFTVSTMAVTGLLRARRVR